MLRGSAVFAFRGHSAQRSGIRQPGKEGVQINLFPFQRFLLLPGLFAPSVTHIVHNTPKNNAANLVRYMGTREGVEKLPPGKDDGDATVRQQRLIKSLIEADPDSKKYLEYRDYENAPPKSNAAEFIDAFIERNADRTGAIDKLVKYMAERPGVEKLGSHGLFSQTDDKIDLNAVAEEIGSRPGKRFSQSDKDAAGRSPLPAAPRSGGAAE